MKITFDPEKRQQTLEHRGLDFADAGVIFEGDVYTQVDNRYEYSEPRYQTYGYLKDRLVMFAWTETNDGIRVISMRKCNDREQRKFKAELGR
jgi:uncharacterized DUF497 family protein